VAHVGRDGTLEIDGRPAAAQTLVVNVSGTAIDLDGRVVARPRDGLVAYRIPVGAHVRSLARGLAPDGWTGSRLRYQAWPVQPGRYELRIFVPRGTATRVLHIGTRTLTLRGGEARRLTFPTNGTPLKLTVDIPDSPLSGGRILGVKVRSLRFVPV
jgi:hypothetical protein